jgi:hypothetical protein
VNRPSGDRTARWARLLLIGAAALAVWALIVAITGGIRYDIGPLRVSSRNPIRPTLVALLFASIAWRLAYEEVLNQHIRHLSARPRRIEGAIVALATLYTLVFTLAFGVRAAGGADPLGYVSQSALWLAGALRVDQAFSADIPWPAADETFVPLGYRAVEGHVMVPTYAPGLALLMAGARLLTECGPYYVGPLCAAALVVLTYLLGRKYFSPAAGVVAAVLTAASPVVVYMAMAPMADVPVATFWMAALLIAAPSSARRAAAAGIVTGIAIAIRPNLVPLAIFPWLLAILPLEDFRAAMSRSLGYAAGVLPFVMFVAILNRSLYGSPFESGYGPLSGSFSVQYFGPNVARYPRWWLKSQGILSFLFVLAVVRRVWKREQLILAGFAITVLLSYLFYLPFDVWWFLRFLLPAVPLALLFCADAIDRVTSFRSPAVRLAAFLVFTLFTLAHVADFNLHIAITETGEGEQKYVDAGVFIGEVTPPDAVIIGMQLGGSIRYYSGRLGLRYDLLDPAWLDRAIDELERRGRPIYLFLDEWEVPVFRKRFAGQRSVAVVERAPMAVGRNGRLNFWAIDGAPVNWSSPRIPHTSRFDCRGISPGFWTAGSAR